MQKGFARRRTGWIVVLLSVAACAPGGQGSAGTSGAPNGGAAAADSAAAGRLSNLSGFVIAVAPTQAASSAVISPNSPPPSATLLTMMDRDLQAAFRDRDVGKSWVFGDALTRSFRTNPTYAADPGSLAVEPLRSTVPQAGSRVPEPLATQLRTMIALHDAVLVLLPVELRLKGGGADLVRPVQGTLRIAIIDPRASVFRMVSDVVSDTASQFGPVITASLASKVASLFIPR
jgi:hypothetical protein